MEIDSHCTTTAGVKEGISGEKSSAALVEAKTV
jgi:hypothetical protein